ncbi:hypothetical protein EBT31_02860 [bacterium]|nr:hypothetical protein [bacterium]
MSNLDPNTAFDGIKNAAIAAVRGLFPIKGAKNVLTLEDVFVDDKKGPNAIEDQLHAKTRGVTWSVPIKAKLTLTDKDGKVLDKSTVTIASIPRLTQRYTYIIGGHERQVDGQFMLKPGVYHRVAANGDVEAQWNLQVGHGFKLSLQRNAANVPIVKFTIKTSNVPVYPVLRALGISDEQMASAWGQRIFEENKKVGKWKELLKIPKVLAKKEADRALLPTLDDGKGEAVASWVRDMFSKTSTKRPNGDTHNSLGVDFDSVDGTALFASTTRIIHMAAGKEKEDDRQSLAAKDFAHIEDLLPEVLQKSLYGIVRKVRNNLDRQTRISSIVSSSTISGPILSLFSEGQIIEQHNPLAFISGHLRTGLHITGERTDLSQDQLINATHIGLLDPIQTPEGETTGISLHLPIGARKRGRDLVTSVWDLRQNKLIEATARMLERAVVAHPDQVTWPNGMAGPPKPVADHVVVYDKDKSTGKRPWGEVDYVFPSAKALFSFSANKVPFLSTVSGNRAMMAAKQQEQAVSLVHREVPLVQAHFANGKSFDDTIGKMSAHVSPVDGEVIEVTEKKIRVRAADGKVHLVELYHHFPLNGGKSTIHATPIVKVGAQVKRGDVLADTNFTRNGTFTAGVNLHVAYLPYAGLTFEDGIVISESAAKRLTSDHLYNENVHLFDGYILDKKRWMAVVAPEKRKPAALAKLDDRGVIRVGERVAHGDILVAALAPTRPTLEEQELGLLHKSLRQPYSERPTLYWHHESPGVVKRVEVLPDNVIVHVYVEEPMQVGDKLTARYGNKGIISHILPDAEMPKTKDGKHVEVLLSPAGVPGRMNIGQVLETAAGKIVQKTGKPYLIDNFAPGVDYSQKVKDDLKKHGLSDTEMLFDGKTGAPLGQVLTGPQHMLKLHHQVEKKITARSYGAGYTSDGMPTSGSGIPGGGQKADQLMMYAMLAHGAKANLREMQTWKSDDNQREIWYALQRGAQLPNPQPNYTMKRFEGLLRTMGIDMRKTGDDYHLAPLTDKQTLAFSNGEIKMGQKALTAKGLRTLEDAGGLFDRKVTGGINGPMWGHMVLAERMPNPVFADQIQALTGMKSAEYEEMVSGKNPGGFNTILSKLRSVDVDQELKKTEKVVETAKGSALNIAVRKLRYLKLLKAEGATPYDAYSHSLQPVLPPKMRSVKIDLNGDQTIDDLNMLYKQVGIANDQLKRRSALTDPHQEEKLRADLYRNIEALRVAGADLGVKGKDKHYFGVMETMKGTPQPKNSLFHSGIVGRRQDLSARSTIVPAPHLSLDEIGVPSDIGLEIFKPFVVREMVARLGYSPLEAQKLIKEKSQIALDALHRVAADRPVLAKRDPSLHKHSLLAFRAKITGGKAIGLHPLVCSGFNADFDGDQMPLFVPVSQEAVAEAKNMLPTKNLFSPTHFGVMMMPEKDAAHGVYLATEWPPSDKPPVAFKDFDEVIRELKAHKLRATTEVQVAGVKTTAGRAWLASPLPESAQRTRILTDKQYRMPKKEMAAVLSWIGKEHGLIYAKVADTFKDCGNFVVYQQAASFSINDFHDGHALREKVLAPYKKKEAEITASSLSKAEKDAQIVELYTKALGELKSVGEAAYKGSNNKVFEWSASGAGKGWDQFGQLVMGPILVKDAKGRTIPIPITKSWGEGLPFNQYWSSLNGARKGAIDRSNSTKDPGALTKDLINTVINYRIESEDCGTTEGSVMSIGDVDLVGRYLAKPVEAKGHPFAAKTLITPAIIAELRKEGVSEVVARSPLHCHAAHGLCATCFGHSENGVNHKVGANVGVMAGQALGEPVTQLVMRTFHTGGAVSASQKFETGAFKRADNLLKVPKTLRGSAILAEHPGVVTLVAEDKLLGGHAVHVGAAQYHIPADRGAVLVKKGDSVVAGQPLCDGPLNPREILETTGSIHKVRNYLSKELHEVYQLAAPIRMRNVETIVKAMTNVAFIDAAPPGSPYTRGQHAPMSAVEEYNRQNKDHPVEYHSVLKPITEVPLTIQEDWMARANYRELKDTFTEGAAQGWRSNIRTSTVAGIAHGAEFGVTQK